MADLNVQKRKKSILPWVLLGLGILALLIYIIKSRSSDDTTNTTALAADSTGSAVAGTLNKAADKARNWWDGVDMNAPAEKFDEITDQNIDVRGNSTYSIYGMGENILFDESKSTIRPQAEANLKEILASVDKRYNGGELRVYGYTDAAGSAGSNKKLAEERAEAVRTWMINNGHVSEKRISVHAIGESNPVASNSTENGRRQNRRVEIVARGQQ